MNDVIIINYIYFAVCLGSHRVGINQNSNSASVPPDLRTCVTGNTIVVLILVLIFMLVLDYAPASQAILIPVFLLVLMV